jgi:hypothetical protein
VITHAQLTKAFFMLFIVLAVAACSRAEPMPTVVSIDAPAPILPEECRTAGDPRWTSPPDADVRRRKSAELWNRNHDAFDNLAGRRRVCADSLAANFDKPKPRGPRAEPAE